MRLLAHGGNEYTERRRIGLWPLIAAGPLEDAYGLSGDGLSFGCGLLENDPILIIRQAQKQGQRLYAYSLLLEPGARVWETFEWNAASLVLALFGGVEPADSTPDCLGRLLLERPEQFSEEHLASFLDELRPPDIVPAETTSDLASLWVGAIYSPEPVTVAPPSIGIAGRPSLTLVASTLQSLRPCFRAGLGWLIGGSASHSRAFGAHLALDDWATQESAAPPEQLRAGAWIISAWESLAAHESYRRIANEKLGTPIWKWDEVWRKSPAKSFERVYCLAKALGASLRDEEIVNAIQDDLDGDGPLEKEIRDAVHRRVISRVGPLSRNLTVFLLRDHFDKGLIVDDATAERMDAPTVIEFYTDAVRRISPTPENGSPLHQARVRFEIWLTLISTEAVADKLPALLRRACCDLKTEESVRTRIAEIVEASVSRSVALTNSLEMWIAHRRDEILGPLISAGLRDKSLRRALKQTDNWARDYLAFGQDSGGGEFARRELPSQSVQILVAEVAKWAGSEDGLSLDARKWLSDLALSSLRIKLPIKDKVVLRESLSNGWESFHAMLELYWGDQTAAKVSVPSAKEREVLIAELTELTTIRFREDFVPNLRGLVSFLGQLPDETVTALASLRPKLIGHDITGWLEGWEKLRPADVYQSELIRQVMHSDREFRIPTLLKKLSDEKVVELFKQLMFGESALPDEELSKRFARFVEYAVKDPSLADKIAVAFKDCETDHPKRSTFFRRHCDKASFLSELFRCLNVDSQQLVISIIFNRNFERIEGDACRNYTDSAKINFDLTPYKRAVFRFALSAAGRSLQEAIATHEKVGRLSLVESRLKEVLRNSDVEDEPAVERNEKRSFWKRLLFD